MGSVPFLRAWTASQKRSAVNVAVDGRPQTSGIAASSSPQRGGDAARRRSLEAISRWSWCAPRRWLDHRGQSALCHPSVRQRAPATVASAFPDRRTRAFPRYREWLHTTCVRLLCGSTPSRLPVRYGREGSRMRARSLRLLIGAVDRRRRGFQSWGSGFSSEAPAVLGRPGEACQLTRPRPRGAFGGILRHGSAVPVHERIRDHGVENRVDGGVDPENETAKKGTVLIGGTGSYERITGIWSRVQAFGVVSDGEWRERFGAFAGVEGSPQAALRVARRLSRRRRRGAAWAGTATQGFGGHWREVFAIAGSWEGWGGRGVFRRVRG